VHADLFFTVYTALQAFAAGRGVPIDIPNVTPPDAIDGAHVYLRAAVLPTDPFVHDISRGEALHTWIVLVTAHTIDGAGEIEIAEHADALARAFPYGSHLDGGEASYKVARIFSPRPAVRQDGDYYIPTRARVQVVGVSG